MATQISPLTSWPLAQVMSTSNPLRVRGALVDRSTAINGLADCVGELSRDPLRAHDRRAGVMRALINLGAIAHIKDLAEARRLYQESATISQKIGDRQNLAIALSNLAACRSGSVMATKWLHIRHHVRSYPIC